MVATVTALVVGKVGAHRERNAILAPFGTAPMIQPILFKIVFHWAGVFMVRFLENLVDDIFKSLRDGLSYDGKLYALPFYGESSMLMYRKDILGAKGLTMPDHPNYEDLKGIADALTDKSNGVYGITLRGKPGRRSLSISIS